MTWYLAFYWFIGRLKYRQIKNQIKALEKINPRQEALQRLSIANWQNDQPRIKAALFLIQGGGIAGFLPLIEETTTFGADAKNIYQLTDRYIDTYQCVSRYEQTKNIFTIYDGNPTDGHPASANGTYVNSQKIKNPDDMLELDKAQRLKSGDIIQFGPLPFVRYSFRTVKAEDIEQTENKPTESLVDDAPTEEEDGMTLQLGGKESTQP